MTNWRDDFAPHILARGVKYFEEGRVGRLQRSGTIYNAAVMGTVNYEVRIALKEKQIESLFCSCPYAQKGENCKHMAAVLLALEAEDVVIEELAPAKMPTIISHVPMEMPWLEAIDRLPEAVVRRELMKRADRDDGLKERLAVLYLGKLPEGQLQNWKADLQEMAGECADYRGRIDDEDTWLLMDEFYDFLTAKLKLLSEAGSTMDAFHLIWIVMETALEWETDDFYEARRDLFGYCSDELAELSATMTDTQRQQMQQWYREHRNEEWPGGVENMDDVFLALSEWPAADS